MQSQADHYEIVTDAEALRSLQREWDALHARSAERRFSRSFTWCWTTWETVERPRGCRLIGLVARNDGRAVLIWPFVVSRELCWSLARPLGSAYGEYSGVLVEDGPASPRRIASAWRQIRSTCGGDIITLSCVRDGSELHGLLESERNARITEIVPTLAVEWSADHDWEGYQRRLDADLRRKLRKGRRELAQLGRLVFEPTEGGPGCVAVIDWLLPRKVDQLARSARRGPWLETEAYRNLLCEAATRASPAGCVTTFALKLDGRIIAALMSRADTRRLEMLNTVFDPAYGRHRPGHILMEECLRWACERRLDFDLRIGDFRYKRSWSNSACDAVTYACVNSPWGHAHVAYREAQRRLRQARQLVPAPWRRRLKAALGRGTP